jgi:hypothetical protein
MNNLIKKNSTIRKWIKDNGCDGWAAFDFKDEDVILYDGGLISIKNKTKIHRKRRKSQFGKDFKVKKLACTFYFGSLDETIEYLIKTRNFLNKLGYSTSGTLQGKDL